MGAIASKNLVADWQEPALGHNSEVRIDEVPGESEFGPAHPSSSAFDERVFKKRDGDYENPHLIRLSYMDFETQIGIRTSNPVLDLIRQG